MSERSEHSASREAGAAGGEAARSRGVELPGVRGGERPERCRGTQAAARGVGRAGTRGTPSIGSQDAPPATEPRRRNGRRVANALVMAAAVVLFPLPLLAAGIASTGAERPAGLGPTIQHFLNQLRDPWTWFGLSAQGLFFLRFFWQWVVSERHKRSIVPVAFWYFSLTGALSMLVYGIHRQDLVVMLSGMIPCPIYIRNLMLIYGRAERLRRAGLPTGPIGSTVTDEDLPG